MYCRTSKKERSAKGALMAAALLLMIVGGMFLSSWISLINARGNQVTWLEAGIQRRLSLENSRGFAWQSALENAFEPFANLASNRVGVLGAGGFGGINTLDGWSSLNIYSSTVTAGTTGNVFPHNYTGLRTVPSYILTQTFNRPVSLSGIDRFQDFLFLKTYPPVLAGDLFVTYRKPDSAGTQLDVSADTADHKALWVVEGRTVIRDPASLFSKTTPSPVQLPFLTRSLYIQSHDSFNARSICGTTTTSTGATARLLPSNLPVVPTSTGPVSAKDDDHFRGYLNVINNPLNPDNSLWHFMDREKAAGRTDYRTLDVFVQGNGTGTYFMDEQKDPQYKPPMWPSGYPASGLRVLYINLGQSNLPNLRIHGVVHQIVFRGQTTSSAFEAAGTLPPAIFTLLPMGESGPSVRDIRFEGENNRRIVIGAKHWNAAPLDLTWEGNPISGSEHRWRTVLINEYHTVMLNLPAALSRRVRWFGGVMTNWTFKRRASGGINADRLAFARDDALTTLAPTGASFASVLPRDAWLESYFLLEAPSP